MEYLIRFAQCHETFRLPEIQSLATLAGAELEIVSYNDHVSDESLRAFKSVLKTSIKPQFLDFNIARPLRSWS